MLDELSIAVVGVGFDNPRRKGKARGDRQMEILLSEPGEAVVLVHEPTNPADADAIAVFSARGIQIGYVVADRTNIIHKAWQAAREVRAIFQEVITGGAAIRVGFDHDPTLPPTRAPSAQLQPDLVELDSNPNDDGFYPDYTPPDE